MVVRSICLSLLLGIAVQHPAIAQSLSPQQIVEKVKPSTVLVQALVGHGSGLVLDKTGLILTNRHVVAIGAGLKVRLHLKIGGSVVLTDIPEVKLVKVHPMQDLALLQATLPAGAICVPAEIAPAEVRAGEVCFALGNPGGPHGNALELTITQGLVSVPKKVLGNQEFVQVSAALNPGSSGGPICDDRGRVFGIATAKAPEATGVGFAVSLHNLTLKNFVDPNLKAGNPQEAEEIATEARRFLALSQMASGTDKQALLMKAVFLLHEAVQADSANPAYLNHMASAHERLGDIATAIKLCEAALALDPGFPNSLSLLGTFVTKQDARNGPKALEYWARGAANSGGGNGALACAEKAAVLAYDMEKYVAAAYMLRWAGSLVAAKEKPPGKIAMYWNLIEPRVPGDCELLKGFAGPFEPEVFHQLVKGAPLSSIKVLAGKMPTARVVPDPPKMPAREAPVPKVNEVGDQARQVDASAQPGKAFQRKLSVPKGSTVVLESGPKGMTLDTSTQSLNWNVPAEQPKGKSVAVILIVKSSEGLEEYLIEKITVP